MWDTPMRIADYEFAYVASIEPDKHKDGSVAEFRPQDRYNNKRGDPLNRHGAGSFCRFRVSQARHDEGVYAITINGQTKYIGECVNLAQRFSSAGYGGISPKNCFQGGQPTNCKINKKILHHAKQRDMIELWFIKTEPGNARKVLESRMINSINPEWNGRT